MTAKSADLGADIFSIPSERKPYEFELKHPASGKGMGFFLTLQSLKSEPVKKITKEIENERQKLAKRGKVFNADELRNNAIRICNAALLGWRWGDDADGKPGHAGGEQLEYNIKNVLRVLQVDDIRDQIESELNEDANFF